MQQPVHCKIAHASSTYNEPLWIWWLFVCSLEYPLSDSERLAFPLLPPCWDEISPPMKQTVCTFTCVAYHTAEIHVGRFTNVEQTLNHADDLQIT